MPKVLPAKQDIFFEEIEAGSAVSEDTISKIASSINFWNNFYESSFSWRINGRYDIFGPQAGIDGAHVTLFDTNIYGFGAYNIKAGTSGVTEFDITVFPPSGPSFSLFLTRPSFNFASGDNARLIYYVSSNTVLFASPFSVTPSFSQTLIPAGSMLTLSTTSVQNGGENCGVIIFVRPNG